MSVIIAEASRDSVRDLIYSQVGGTTADRIVLQRWLARSEHVWVGENDGELVCTWGLVPPTLLSDYAYLWMISFPGAEEHQFVLVRHSQLQIQEMLKRHPYIIGHCEAKAERSIRWLRWLGAEFKATPKNGLVEFRIRRKDG